MSATAAPNGLRPIGRHGNGPYEGGFTEYPLTTDNTYAMAVGDLVALVGGSVVLCAADSAAGTLGANSPLGVALGFSYIDAVNKRQFVNSEILPASAVTGFQLTSIMVKVADDPAARFLAQADGAVAQAKVGYNCGLTGYHTADTTMRTSKLAVSASGIATTNTLPFKIVKIAPLSGNAAGDAYTWLHIQYNAGTHAFSLATGH